MLEEDTIFENLSDIGPSQSGLQLIYTRLDLSSRSLSQIEAISNFKQLQHIDVSFNLIHDVTPLLHLHNLLSLDASHNKINVRNIMQLKNREYSNIQRGHSNVSQRNILGF